MVSGLSPAYHAGDPSSDERRMATSNTPLAPTPSTSGKPPAPGMAWIPGGTFLMGSDRHYPEEAPAHRVAVEGFWIDTHTVINADFRTSSVLAATDAVSVTVALLSSFTTRLPSVSPAVTFSVGGPTDGLIVSVKVALSVTELSAVDTSTP